MKQYSPSGRRSHGRPLKRLLDRWDRNGSTSDPTPWQIYDNDEQVTGLNLPCSIFVSIWMLHFSIYIDVLLRLWIFYLHQWICFLFHFLTFPWYITWPLFWKRTVWDNVPEPATLELLKICHVNTEQCPNEYQPVIKSCQCKCCCHWSNITGTQHISCKWRRTNSDCEYVWSKLWYRIIRLYWVIYFELKIWDLYLVGYTTLASWVI